MRSIFTLILVSCLFLTGLKAQTYNGKPQYDVLVRQYPDTFGTYRMELFPTIAPLHTYNFDTLAQQGFYDSLAFHRVVANFVIQGGDPNSRYGPPNTWGQGAPWQQTVQAEFTPLEHNRGVIGAARSTNINSATSQFYINLVNNQNLNGNYTAYGRVISGLDVVDSVAAVPVDGSDRPLDKIDMFIQYVGMDTSSPSQAPTLTAPADSAEGLFGLETFAWSFVNTGDFLMYKIQFSKQPDFSVIEYEEDFLPSRTNTKPLENLEQGYVRYYWRVLTNNGGRMLSSEVRTFTTFIAPPQLVHPANNATGLPTNTSFEWDSVPGADEYNLVVSTFPILTVPNLIVADTTTSFTGISISPIQGNSNYFWGVRSIVDSIAGIFSESWEYSAGIVPSGIEDEKAYTYKIYPNPTQNDLNIDLSEGLNNAEIKIFNSLGLLIWSGNSSDKSIDIDLSSWAIGTYFYRIEGNKTIQSGKFIKQ